jgi:hypothetical protein
VNNKKKINEKEKWRPKKKETKYHFETIRRGVYYQNCYNVNYKTFFSKYANKMIIILINVPKKLCLKDVLQGKLF